MQISEIVWSRITNRCQVCYKTCVPLAFRLNAQSEKQMAQVVKKIVIGVIAVNIVVLILVFAFLPSETHIERTINIDAPRELVYAQVVDLREFHKWSPWTGRTGRSSRSRRGCG